MESITDIIAPATQFASQSFSSFADLVSKLNLFILLPIIFAVSSFMVSYFRNYQRPAEAIRGHLTELVDQIRGARMASASALAVDSIFSQSPFRPLWQDYCSSLHMVEARNGTKTILAGMPAEAFFSREAVVDLHINADFFRHLPGILTGIGIIGTFSGLVWGLHQFTPESSDPLSSLPALLQEVTSAFIGSGFAILAAIFVTYKEKSILNSCYRSVRELNREIDSLYASGAGEEYLARLVSASENQALLQQQNNHAVAQQIGVSIRDALSLPMMELGAVVERVVASQETAIGSILDEVLKTFAGRLEDTFGGQIEKVNQSFEKASRSMEQVQQSMTVLLGDMASVGANAVDQMAGTLAVAVENASATQDRVNEQTAVFIDELRGSLMAHQNQSAEVMEVSMRAVLTKLQSSMAKLATDRNEQIGQDQRRIEALTASVARLVESVDASSTRTGESMATLQNTTAGAISGMNNGAIVMRMAADRFAMAGNTLADALEKADGLTHTVESLQELAASTAQLRRAV